MWKKIGQLYDPREFDLPLNCKGFAKSPQALVKDDSVRIYFCAAEKDAKGKLLSRVLYVDFDRSFKHLLKLSTEEVIPLGSLGSFDEHGIFPFSVFQDEDTISAYTTGWNRRKSVSVDGGIGYAISRDGGETFEKLGAGGPILGPSLHEPFLVCDGFVKKFNGVYKMWYIYGVKWIDSAELDEPQRVYKIASATSTNGIDWDKDGTLLIPDQIDENECQALPTVEYHNGLYHMYFCYRHALGFRDSSDKGYRLGYAVSEDLNNWERKELPKGLESSAGEWDSSMMCYPNLFKIDEKLYMLYNGNEFGKTGFGLAEWQDK